MCKLSVKQKNIDPDDYDHNFNKPYNIFSKRIDDDLPIIKTSKKQHETYLSESEETTPWSNAFNFKKFLGTSVDPRTGILSAHIKTGS
ncbi:MAG: hypothetical protein OXC48_01320, partial [Endozoicomonadaceae bacterium]|nr:hypothetical protein [Endozoicomonadaceae bacterium]